MNILIDGQTLHTAEIDRGIGTYFKEMIESMLRNDFTSKFYITIDDEKKLDCFSEYVKNKIVSIKNENANSLFLSAKFPIESAKINYSNFINDICEEMGIDIYWNANPLMDNVYLPEKKCKSFFTATIHDLIPLVMNEIYFKMWNENIILEYKNKLELLKKYDFFYPISEYTRKDIVEHLGIEENRQIVTFEGVDKKFKPYPFPKIDVDEKYVLYIGGFDPRKNMFRAIEAFSYFMNNLNEEKINYKLYLVCSLDENSRNKLLNFVKEKKIENSIYLTGFVEEIELLKLYQKASCFFFPSLYEGFGLPILEALASGLPLASANNSSLPEVAGKYANYFDAYDIEDMAKSLAKTLKEDNDIESRFDRYKYASKFNWEEPTKILLDGFYELIKKENIKEKKKIAWVSPFPPQKSGISNYSKILIFSMKDKVKIDVYYDEILPEKEICESFDTFKLDELPKNFSIYDEVIYHLGNNSNFHTNIYKYSWNYPSTIVIHDWNIHPFMQHSFLNIDGEQEYYEEALKVYGENGKNEMSLIKQRGYPDIWKFSMSDAISQRSKRVIVHHQWIKEQMINKNNVDVIPLFSFIKNIPTEDDISNFKNKYLISSKEFIISCFGDINLNKLPNIQIEAVKQLIDLGYPIKLIFIGKLSEEAKYLFKKLDKYENSIIITGYLKDNEYYSCMNSSDLIINLRNPSMGEASLTLSEAFYMGKPVIIGNSNQYKEFPDEIVAGKVDYNGKEVKQLVDLLKQILSNRDLALRISKKSKDYVYNNLSLEKIIKLYLDI